MKMFGVELKFNGFDIFHKGNSGSGSGFDADTVDGKHLNQGVQTTDSPTFANVYTPSIENFKTNGSLTNKAITTDTTQIAQSPISGLLWHDIFAFNRVSTPTFQTSADGTTWVNGTLDNNLFSHKENQSIVVLNSATTKAVRWTWSSGISWSSLSWIVLAFTYVATSCNKTVLIESSADGVTWTTRHTSTNTYNAQPVWFYTSSTGGDAYLRITLTYNSGGNINLSSIRGLTSRWGDQGLGSEISYPYDWDSSKNMTVLGSWLKIGSNTVWHSGNFTPPTTLPANGGNSDTVDNKHASDFATSAQGTKADAALPSSSYTADDVLSKIKTVDGTGSELDADLLDGQEGSYYSNYNNLNNTPTIPTKLSQLQNDIGAGGGVKITTDSIAPTSPSPGDFWYKVK